MKLCIPCALAIGTVFGAVLTTQIAAGRDDKHGQPVKIERPAGMKDAGGHGDMKMDPCMEAAMKLGTPGPEHKMLDQFVGNWNAEVKMWMDPKAEPQVSKGTMHSTWAHGGRYVMGDYKGEFNGMEFTGTAITAYDNADKTYKGLWIDSWSTGMTLSTGTMSADGKSMTNVMEALHPAKPDGKLVKTKMREAIQVVSKDKHIMTMFMTEPGAAEVKVMEITYTRADAHK